MSVKLTSRKELTVQVIFNSDKWAEEMTVGTVSCQARNNVPLDLAIPPLANQERRLRAEFER